MQSAWFFSVDRGSVCSTEDELLAQDSAGKRVNLWVLKAWSKEKWGLLEKRRGIAEEDRKHAGQGLESGKWMWRQKPSWALQLNCTWGWQHAQSHVWGGKRTQLCHSHKAGAAFWTGLCKEGAGRQQGLRWAGLGQDWGLQTSSGGPAASMAVQRHTEISTSDFFFFLFLGRLMSLWQSRKGRFTE